LLSSPANPSLRLKLHHGNLVDPPRAQPEHQICHVKTIIVTIHRKDVSNPSGLKKLS
jgi:hypothetical protein